MNTVTPIRDPNPRIDLQTPLQTPIQHVGYSNRGFIGDIPQITEITVHYHGGGKVALEEYGKKSADYGASVSRKYSIPSDWDDEQVQIFELEKVLEIRDELDPLLQEEHDNIMAQRNF